MPPTSSMQRMVLCSGKSDLMGTLHITMIDDVCGHGCSNRTLFRTTVVQVDLGQYGFLRFWAGISRPPGTRAIVIRHFELNTIASEAWQCPFREDTDAKTVPSPLRLFLRQVRRPGDCGLAGSPRE